MEIPLTQILSTLGAVVTGSVGTALIQGFINRRKNKAEADKVSAETAGVNIKNSKDIETFYSDLLEGREDLAEKIYKKLLLLEEKTVAQKQEYFRSQRKIAILLRVLTENEIEIPNEIEINGPN